MATDTKVAPVDPVFDGFEGPEKNLEIDFKPGVGSSKGLREITKDQWSDILKAANCSILCNMSTKHLDSYVLSESSLFVYKYKMIIKTCGTTTLLKTIPEVLRLTKELGMKVEWVGYTRKDYLFPERQLFPQRHPKEETQYLQKFFPEGSSWMLGPMTGDHWFVFVADYCDRSSSESVDRTLHVRFCHLDGLLYALTVVSADDDV